MIASKPVSRPFGDAEGESAENRKTTWDRF